MASVLNPRLYNLLQSRFAKVVIANAGQQAHIYYTTRHNKPRAMLHGGEYYRVNCPMCTSPDTRQHLWISYKFGDFDPRLGQYILWPTVCYRCHGRIVDSSLMDVLRPSFGKFSIAPAKIAEGPPPPPEAMPLPEARLVRLDALSPVHPAIAYLRRRGFSPREVGKPGFCWMYCRESPNPFAARRLFLPIFHEVGDKLRMVGYQTRSLPGLSVFEDPKYWIAPGTPKSRVLYNLPVAQTHSLLVLTEGVTDAARAGPQGVALLGSSLSEEQARLLFTRCSHARVAVVIDADMVQRGYDMARLLNSGGWSDRRLKGGAFMVPLERGDPADYTREELFRRIAQYDKQTAETRRTT